jgi:hypothetical protein
MTGIIEQISKVLSDERVEHHCDTTLKNPKRADYYRIYYRKNKNLFVHVTSNDKIHAVVRKTKNPSIIEEKYGIKGIKMPKRFSKQLST